MRHDASVNPPGPLQRALRSFLFFPTTPETQPIPPKPCCSLLQRRPISLSPTSSNLTISHSISRRVPESHAGPRASICHGRGVFRRRRPDSDGLLQRSRPSHPTGRSPCSTPALSFRSGCGPWVRPGFKSQRSPARGRVLTCQSEEPDPFRGPISGAIPYDLRKSTVAANPQHFGA